MSNLLKVAMIDLIRSLHRQGLSQRQIASKLGINRETVARYLRQPGQAPKPAIAPSGSVGADAQPKPAIAPSGSPSPERGSRGACHRGRRSDCEPWRDVISAKCDLGLSAQRIYQDLVCEHGFPARYHSVQRYVRRLGSSRALPFRRLECAPGEEAQVDYGSGPHGA